MQRWTLNAAWMLPGLLACVSTDLEPATKVLSCVAGAAPTVTPESIVAVTVAYESSYVICSGVTVAPTLVLTTASCLLEPLGGHAAPDYAQLCDSASGWAPFETGSFSARNGNPYDLDQISITTAALDEIGVRDVKTVATSRCADDLAVVVLERPISTPNAFLRLNEDSHGGDPVILSALDFQDEQFVFNRTDSTVIQLTFDSGDSLAPPRSLLLANQVCYFSRGGAVFSAESGALVGMIAWGSGECDAPEGTTTAVRLSPFRRFIVQSAEDVGETLKVERNTLSKELAPCASE